MIGLVRRSSSRKPSSGSEAVTGMPRMVGTGGGVGVAIGRGVLTVDTPRGGVGGAGSGVAVAGSARGVSSFEGLNGVGVGGGGGEMRGPHAEASKARIRTQKNRRTKPLACRIIPAAGILGVLWARSSAG